MSERTIEVRDIFVCIRASGSSLNAVHTVLCGCVEGLAVQFSTLGVRPSGVRIQQLLAWCLARLKGTINCIYWEMTSRFSRIPHVWSDSGYTPMRQCWKSSDTLLAC